MYVHRDEDGMIVLISWAPIEGLAEEYIEEDSQEIKEFYKNATQTL